MDGVLVSCYAEKRTRTSTPLRGLEPESSASANSAISARKSNLCSSIREVNRLEFMRAKNSRARGGSRRRAPEVSKEDLVRYIQTSADRGINLQRILEDFDATPVARRQIKDILNQLVKEGKVAKHRGNRYEAAARNLIEGTILVHRDGYGFVIPKERVPGVDSDIYIPGALVGSAMNGDRVKVEITLRKSGGRAEGRVVTVEKRARDTVVCQLRFDGQAIF